MQTTPPKPPAKRHTKKKGCEKRQTIEALCWALGSGAPDAVSGVRGTGSAELLRTAAMSFGSCASVGVFASEATGVTPSGTVTRSGVPSVEEHAEDEEGAPSEADAVASETVPVASWRSGESGLAAALSASFLRWCFRRAGAPGVAPGMSVMGPFLDSWILGPTGTSFVPSRERGSASLIRAKEVWRWKKKLKSNTHLWDGGDGNLYIVRRDKRVIKVLRIRSGSDTHRAKPLQCYGNIAFLVKCEERVKKEGEKKQ